MVLGTLGFWEQVNDCSLSIVWGQALSGDCEGESLLSRGPGSKIWVRYEPRHHSKQTRGATGRGTELGNPVEESFTVQVLGG